MPKVSLIGHGQEPSGLKQMRNAANFAKDFGPNAFIGGPLQDHNFYLFVADKVYQLRIS